MHNNPKMKTTQVCISCEWMNKLWAIHTMEYCSFTKRNKLQVHVRTWMNLKNVVLSERSQIKKRVLVYNSIYMTF